MYQNLCNVCFSFQQPMIQNYLQRWFQGCVSHEVVLFPLWFMQTLASVTSYSNNFHSSAIHHAKEHLFLFVLSLLPISFTWCPLVLVLEETSHKQSPSTLSMSLVGSLISATSSSLGQSEEPSPSCLLLVQKWLLSPGQPSCSSEPLRWTKTAENLQEVNGLWIYIRP